MTQTHHLVKQKPALVLGLAILDREDGLITAISARECAAFFFELLPDTCGGALLFLPHKGL